MGDEGKREQRHDKGDASDGRVSGLVYIIFDIKVYIIHVDVNH